MQCLSNFPTHIWYQIGYKSMAQRMTNYSVPKMTCKAGTELLATWRCVPPSWENRHSFSSFEL